MWLQVSDRAQAGRRRKNLSSLRKRPCSPSREQGWAGRGDTPSPPSSLADGLPYLTSAEDEFRGSEQGQRILPVTMRYIIGD